MFFPFTIFLNNTHTQKKMKKKKGKKNLFLIGISDLVNRRTVLDLKTFVDPSDIDPNLLRDIYIYPPTGQLNTLDKLAAAIKDVKRNILPRLHNTIIPQLLYRFSLVGYGKYTLYDVTQLLMKKFRRDEILEDPLDPTSSRRLGLNENELDLLKWMINEEPGWFFKPNDTYEFVKDQRCFVWNRRREVWEPAIVLKTWRDSKDCVKEGADVDTIIKTQSSKIVNEDCLAELGRERFQIRYTERGTSMFNQIAWKDLGNLRINREEELPFDEDTRIEEIERDTDTILPMLDRMRVTYIEPTESWESQRASIIAIRNTFIKFKFTPNQIFRNFIDEIKNGVGMTRIAFNNIVRTPLQALTLREIPQARRCFFSMDFYDGGILEIPNDDIFSRIADLHSNGSVEFYAIFIEDRDQIHIDFVSSNVEPREGEAEDRYRSRKRMFEATAVRFLIVKSRQARAGVTIESFHEMTNETAQMLQEQGEGIYGAEGTLRVARQTDAGIINRYRARLGYFNIPNMETMSLNQIINYFERRTEEARNEFNRNRDETTRQESVAFSNMVQTLGNARIESGRVSAEESLEGTSELIEEEDDEEVELDPEFEEDLDDFIVDDDEEEVEEEVEGGGEFEPLGEGGEVPLAPPLGDIQSRDNVKIKLIGTNGSGKAASAIISALKKIIQLGKKVPWKKVIKFSMKFGLNFYKIMKAVQPDNEVVNAIDDAKLVAKKHNFNQELLDRMIRTTIENSAKKGISITRKKLLGPIIRAITMKESQKEIQGLTSDPSGASGVVKTIALDSRVSEEKAVLKDEFADLREDRERKKMKERGKESEILEKGTTLPSAAVVVVTKEPEPKVVIPPAARPSGFVQPPTTIVMPKGTKTFEVRIPITIIQRNEEKKKILENITKRLENMGEILDED